MPLKVYRPLTPSTRYITSRRTTNHQEPARKSLCSPARKRAAQCVRRVTARHWPGHKQKIRNVDFKRDKHGIEATVAAIDTIPCARPPRAFGIQGRRETVHHCSVGLQIGAKLLSGPTAPPETAIVFPCAPSPSGCRFTILKSFLQRRANGADAGGAAC